MAKERSQSFGKRQEFAAISEMLRLGLDIYMTLVDDKGIDCVVRKNADTYYDVQIKARSKNVKHPGSFWLSDVSARQNYFFVFYSEEANKFWVIPYQRIIGSDGKKPLGNQIKSGKTKGGWYIDPWWSGRTERGFKQYENAWHYLGAKKEP